MVTVVSFPTEEQKYLNSKIVCFQALEDFLWQSSDMLDRLDDMREDLNHNDFADEVSFKMIFSKYFIQICFFAHLQSEVA